jgi:site-specific DNA-methyltransferase (adenine-specific)
LGTQPRSGEVPAAQGGVRECGRNPGLAKPNRFFKPWKGDVNYVPQIVSVKGGGNVGVAMVKDLIATVEREKAAMVRRGGFVTLTEPAMTHHGRPMKEEAVSTGFYDQDKWGIEYHRNDRSYKLQILTIEGLMSQTERPRYPDLTMGRSTFKRAVVEDMGAEQGKLLI